MIHLRNLHALSRPVSLLLSLMVFLLPVSALADTLDLSSSGSADVEEISLSSDDSGTDFRVEDYLLPLDFTPGAVPLKSGFSTEKDEQGNNVRIYEDSTIRAVISETEWMKTDIWMADITVSDPSQLRSVSQGKGDFSKKTARGKALTLAKHMNAVVAVNGDSWGAKNEKGPFGVVLRQGNLIENVLDDSGKIRMDLLLIDVNGDFHGLHAARKGDLDDPTVFEGKKIVNIFSFGPILVEDGQAVTDFQGADRDAGRGGFWLYMRHDLPSQRIALCQVGPLHYKIISCAGARSGNRGLSLPEFTEFVQSQGVRFAYNLDGGESAMIYFSGYGKVNLKNTEIRELWDIIYFASAEKQ